MKTSLTPNRASRFVKSNPRLATALACLALACSLPAAQRTWTGAGADNNWNTALNWDTAVPANNDNLIFSGTTRASNTNNIANLVLNGILFNANGFTLGGNAITNTGGVMDNFGSNTNAFIISLGAAQSFTNTAPGSTLLFGGNITNNGYTLSIGGDGSVFLNGILGGTTGASTNTGGLIMNGGFSGGLLRLAGANSFAGSLTVNQGTLRLANGAAIPSGGGKGDVTLGSTASLDLNGNSQTINGLYGAGMIDNQLSTATGIYTLTVGNNATNSAGTFSGAIQNTYGTVALTKVNTNTLTLTGIHSYAGATTISQGTLALGPFSSLSYQTPILVSPGALFDVSSLPAAFFLNSGQGLTAGRNTNGPNDIAGSINSYGNLTIFRAGLAGTMTIGGGLSLGSGVVSFDLNNLTTLGSGTNDLIAINGKLDVSGGTTTILLNPVSGAFAAGTYMLISNNTAQVAGSTANLAVSAPRGITASFDLSTIPGSLLMNVSGASAPASLVWSGNNAAGPLWDVTTTPNWNGGSASFYNLDSVTFNDLGFGNVTVSTGVSPGSTTINNGLTNYIFSGAGAISGLGGLSKSGTGTATFRNANTFTGNTVVNGGTLILDFLNSGAILTQILYNGVSAGSLTLAGGDLQKNNRGNATTYQLFSGTTINAGASRVLQNTRISGGSPAIYLGAMTRNTGGTVDVQANTGSGSTQTANTVGIFTTSTNNSTNAAGILGGYATTGAGAEWARVNASAGQQGGTHIYGGAAYANVFAAGTNTDMTANLTAAANTNTSTVRFNTLAARTLTLSGDNVITTGGILVTPTVAANVSTITGGNTLTSGNGQDLIVHQHDTSGALVIGSVITNNGLTAIALTKSGAGKLTLTANNAYTGATFINAGTLEIGSGGTSGDISTSSGLTVNGTLVFNRSDAVNFSGAIGGIGGMSHQGAGTLTLSGNNAYSGATIIAAGTLQIGNGGTSGAISNSPSVTDGGNLVFNRSDDLTYAGTISGPGALTKLGAGKLTLNGANSYLGVTAISQGTLAIGAAGVISNSAAFVLGSGAVLDVSALGGLSLNPANSQTLSGGGTVKGNVSLPLGTTISPGTSIGTLAFNNNLTLSGGTLTFEIATGSNDVINVGGNIDLTDATVQITVVGTPLTNGTYRLINYAGTRTGSAANLIVAGFSQPGQLAILSDAPNALNLTIISGTAGNLTWKGDSVNNYWDVAVTSDWLNGAVASVFNNNDNVTFNDTGSTTPPVQLVGSLVPASVTVNSVNDYALSSSSAGRVRGGTGLSKNNSGKLTILTVNDNTGPTVINGGTLQVGDGATVGVLGPGTVTNNATLAFNQPTDRTVNNAIAGTGAVTQQGLGKITLTAKNTYTGVTTINSGTVLQVGAGAASGSLTGPVQDDGGLLFNRSGSVTNTGGISGVGGLTNFGVGTLALGGANTYSGNTVITAGTLKLGANEVLPDGPGMGNVVLDGGATAAGTLDLNGFNETINGLSGVTSNVLGRVLNNGGTGTNTLTIGNADTNSTFSGLILNNSGTGGKVALTKIGTNTLTINPSGINAFSGGITISNGTVALAGPTTANSDGPGSGPVTFYGGTLSMAGATGSTGPTYFPALANTLIVPTNQTGTLNGTARGGCSSPLTGGGTLNYVCRYVRGDMSGDWSAFTGVINVTSLSGTSDDYRVNNIAGWPNARMTLGAGVNMYPLTASGSVIPIGELSGVGGLVTAAGASAGQPVVWRVGLLNTTTNFAGGIYEQAGILKDGTGTWTLNGSVQNTHSGVTAVTNGVLALGADTAVSANSSAFETRSSGATLDVTALSSSILNVGSGQTLRGSGTVLGNVNASGTVSPGYAIGTLTISGAITMTGTTFMELNRTNAGATNDMLKAATINAGGTLTVTNVGPPLVTGDSFKLFSFPVSGFTVVDLPSTNAAGTFKYTWNNRLAIDGSIQVASSINVSPTNITVASNGSSFDITWPADHTGWRLQTQTNALNVGISTNWYPVAGSTTTNRMVIPVDTANGTVFYRLTYP